MIEKHYDEDLLVVCCMIKCDAMMNRDDTHVLTPMGTLFTHSTLYEVHNTYEKCATVYPAILFDVSIRF